jgi:large subunit ribosomal protein L35
VLAISEFSRLIRGRFTSVKQKTHSGAKKRLKLLSSGKVKHKQSGKRHLLSPWKSKGKRQAGKTAYVDSANMNQTSRLLNF